ncbi:MAG: hypothetical protein ACF8OB_11340 [Phycisphaeraceae bacterium JB051]
MCLIRGRVITMHLLRRYHSMCRWTIRATLFGGLLLVCSFAFDWDYYENIHEFLEEVDHFELDEILLMAGPIGIGILLDIVRAKNFKQQQVKLYEQHLETLGQTLHGAQDIINNFLNSIQLYILKAHDQKLDPADVDKLERLIEQTTQRLNQLEKPLLEKKQQSQNEAHVNHK